MNNKCGAGVKACSVREHSIVFMAAALSADLTWRPGSTVVSAFTCTTHVSVFVTVRYRLDVTEPESNIKQMASL